jgi:hypothetical protein
LLCWRQVKSFFALSLQNMSVMDSAGLDSHQPPPLYQQDAISWLQRFESTELLQQMLVRFHFSEMEILAYRIRWAAWLKPSTNR